MNKIHWNTIIINGSIPDKLIYGWINDSYNLVVEKLTKSKRNQLFNLT
jgi:predicted DNA-binding protein (MmcQ/YjbR family)